MRKLNVEDLKKDFVGKTFNWLTVLDVFRDDHTTIMFKCQCRCGNIADVRKQYVLSGHTTSCGCYKCSHDKGAKYTEWCKNNPDKVKSISEHFKQTIRDNPEILIKRGEKQSNLYKDHPEIVQKISDSNKKYWEYNPDKLVEHGKNHSKSLLLKRDIEFLEEYREFIHPEDYSLLEYSTPRYIRFKCPRCGKYEYHTFSNIFILRDKGLKSDRSLPICNSCRFNNYSSLCEDTLVNSISIFYRGSVVRNSRSIIWPYELDIYYPEKRIAIEFNGDYWHSEKFKDKDYHYNKFSICRENNILLVSIFETDWNNRKEEIISYLRDLFDNKENSLSFNDDHTLMNNNYPVANNLTIESSHIESSYYYRDSLVYTCGYSKIL